MKTKEFIYDKRWAINYRKSEWYSILLLVSLFMSAWFAYGYICVYIISFYFFFRIEFTIIKRFYFDYFILFAFPQIVIFFHALCVSVINGESFFIPRALSIMLFYLSLIVLSYSLFRLHQERVLDVIYCSVVLYYLLCIIRTILYVGFKVFILNIWKPGSIALTRFLEQHDIGLSIGIFIIWELFYEKKMRRRSKRIFILMIIFLLCYKRIAIGAFVVTCMFMYIIRKYIDKKDRLLFIWGVVGVIVCIWFVYMVQQFDVVQGFLYEHGITTNGRNNLYAYFTPYYEFSPRFLGRGSGFTSKLLTIGARTGNGVGKIVAIHSDILRVFIEYGAIGSLIWYSYYLVFLPLHFKKKYPKRREPLFICALYSFIVYLSDNTTGYPLFQMLYMLVPLCYERISELPKIETEMR